MNYLVLWLISFLSFWGYVTWFIIKYGLPISWSDTFYVLRTEMQKRNAGYIFLGALWGLSIPMLPMAAEVNAPLFLPFVLIAFIGAAVAFKDNEMEYTVHMVSSYASVFTSILIFSLMYNLYILGGIWIGAIAAIYISETKNRIMWIESLTIMTGHIILLVKEIL